jgi:hypothetical protein
VPDLRVFLAVSAVALFWPAIGPAQEGVAPAYRLEPKPMKGIERGKATVVKGEAGSQPHRFVIDGLNMNMPVSVVVRPVRARDEVSLRLTKYAWNQPLREGTAQGKPLAFKFRTEGEFQIAVSSAKASTPYRLLVWVGDEVKPELRPVIVKASEYKGQPASGGMSAVMWVIAGALAVIAALFGVLVLRRRSS